MGQRPMANKDNRRACWIGLRADLSITVHKMERLCGESVRETWFKSAFGHEEVHNVKF